MLKEKDIINLYVHEKYSTCYIGKVFNVSHKTISKYLKDNNIKIRPRSLSVRLSKNILEKRFGKLIVIKYDKNGKYYCKCDCGKVKSIRRDSLIEARTFSCGCYNIQICNKAKVWGEVDKRLRKKVRDSYTQYKNHAKKKQFKFELTVKIFIKLVTNECYYCGNISKRGFNGIDRLNNQRGYTIKNSVSCCDTCNHAKCILSKTKFYNWIKRVYNYSFHKIKG